MRSFFRNAVLGLSLLATSCGNKNPREGFNYQSHEVYGPIRVPPDDFNSSASKNTIKQVLKAASGRQFIGFQDQHNSPSDYEFAASDSMMKALAEAGYKHIFLEIPVLAQKYFDEFKDGKISRQVFNGLVESIGSNPNQLDDIDVERIFESRADMVERGKLYGIKVHCVDSEGIAGDISQAQRDVLLKVAELRIERMRKYFAEHPEYFKITSSKERQNIILGETEKIAGSQLTPEESFYYQQFVSAIQNETPQAQLLRWKARFNKDPEIAQKISQLSGQDKGVILYGKLHFQFLGMGIANSIGRDKTLVVDLWGTEEEKNGAWVQENLKVARFLGAKGVEMPDIGVVLLPPRFVPNAEIIEAARKAGPVQEIR